MLAHAAARRGCNAIGEPMPALDDTAVRASSRSSMSGPLVRALWQEHPIILSCRKNRASPSSASTTRTGRTRRCAFLGELGNPFSAIGVRSERKGAIDGASYGMLGSFLVAADGTILYKRAAPRRKEPQGRAAAGDRPRRLRARSPRPPSSGLPATFSRRGRRRLRHSLPIEERLNARLPSLHRIERQTSISRFERQVVHAPYSG